MTIEFDIKILARNKQEERFLNTLVKYRRFMKNKKTLATYQKLRDANKLRFPIKASGTKSRELAEKQICNVVWRQMNSWTADNYEMFIYYFGLLSWPQKSL
ncbi:hypothetical protein ACFLY0_02325 [Patescibacteria group bacterium]